MPTMREVAVLVFQYQRERRRRVEAWVAKVREANGPLACDGCTEPHCCGQLAMVHPMEGLVIAHSLLVKDERDLAKKVFAQGQRQLAKLREYGFDHSSLGEEPNFEAISTAAEAWFRDCPEPCAFLKDKRCLIYSIRPVVCASYFTAQRCVRRYGAEEMVPTLNNLEPTAFNLIHSTDVLTRIVGLESDSFILPLPLGAAVQFGLEALLAIQQGTLPEFVARGRV